MQDAISSLQDGPDADVLTDIGEVVGDTMNKHVPMREGYLREYEVDVQPNHVTVTWGTNESEPYALYQAEGVVYGPNKPIFRNKLFANEFYTPEGTTKYPTNRKLGERHTVVLKSGKVIFIHGYTTPDTSAHWIEKTRNNPTEYYPMRRKIYEMLADATGQAIVGKRWYT